MRKMNKMWKKNTIKDLPSIKTFERKKKYIEKK